MLGLGTLWVLHEVALDDLFGGQIPPSDEAQIGAGDEVHARIVKVHGRHSAQFSNLLVHVEVMLKYRVLVHSSETVLVDVVNGKLGITKSGHIPVVVESPIHEDASNLLVILNLEDASTVITRIIRVICTLVSTRFIGLCCFVLHF